MHKWHKASIAMHPVEVNTLRRNVVANETHHDNNHIWSEPQWANNIIWFWICTEHSTKIYDVTAWDSHTNCYGGHACRWEWYRQFIEVLGAQLRHNLSKHPVGFLV